MKLQNIHEMYGGRGTRYIQTDQRIIQKRKLEIQSLNYVDINLKLWFLIKSGYYIVPSPSTALMKWWTNFKK